MTSTGKEQNWNTAKARHNSLRLFTRNALGSSKVKEAARRFGGLPAAAACAILGAAVDMSLAESR